MQTARAAWLAGSLSGKVGMRLVGKGLRDSLSPTHSEDSQPSSRNAQQIICTEYADMPFLKPVPKSYLYKNLANLIYKTIYHTFYY